VDDRSGFRFNKTVTWRKNTSGFYSMDDLSRPGERGVVVTGTDVSGDGKVIVGMVNGAATRFIDPPPGSPFFTQRRFPIGAPMTPTKTNSDGSVVLGVSGPISEASLWTDPSSGGNGFVRVGTLLGGSDSFGTGVSEDGRVVVGYGSSTAVGVGSEGFIWNAIEGIRSIYDLVLHQCSNDGYYFVRFILIPINKGILSKTIYISRQHKNDRVLVEAEALTGGWLRRSFDATGVSADGNVIVGYGMHADFSREAWMINLSASSSSNSISVTEPSSLYLLLVGGLLLGLQKVGKQCLKAERVIDG